MTERVCCAALAAWILLMPIQGIAQENTPETNWVTQCVSGARSSTGDCSMEQRLLVQETGQLFATARIRILAEQRTPELVLTIPLGLYLPAGIELEVDGGPFLKIPVRNCDANGCYAMSDLSEADVATMKRGQNLNVTLLNLAQQTVKFDVSLIGFNAAFLRIR